MRTREQNITFSRGFTVIELGIVVAVIAILMSVVLVGRGFTESAKVASAVKMFDTLEQAARDYTIKENGGIEYKNITPAEMSNYLSNNTGGGEVLQTPWGGGAESFRFNAIDGGNGMEIGICGIGKPESLEDLAKASGGKASGDCVNVTIR